MVLVTKFRNVQRLVVEEDNKQIMVSLEEEDGCPNWSLEPLFDQIRVAAGSFEVFKSVWVRRSINTVAHNICKGTDVNYDVFFVL